jgi:hypothetical protein
VLAMSFGGRILVFGRPRATGTKVFEFGAANRAEQCGRIDVPSSLARSFGLGFSPQFEPLRKYMGLTLGAPRFERAACLQFGAGWVAASLDPPSGPPKRTKHVSTAPLARLRQCSRYRLDLHWFAD